MHNILTPRPSALQRWAPMMVLAPFLLWTLFALIPRSDKQGDFAYLEFGRLPVLSNGRVQPIDSLARNALLQLREKTEANTAPWESNPKMLTATQWVLEMMAKPEIADTRPVFRIDHPELKSLLGLPNDADASKQTDGKHYSWQQIRMKLAELQTEAQRAGMVKAEVRTSFDQAVMKLWNGVAVYMRLQNTLEPQNAKNWGQELQEYLKNLPAGVAAARAQQAGKTYDKTAMERIMDDLQRFDTMDKMEPALLIPPANPEKNKDGWMRTGQTLMEVARGQEAPYALNAYARMADAFKNGRPAEFNQAVADYRTSLEASFSKELGKAKWEQYFNGFEPFVKALTIYLIAALCVFGYWFEPGKLDVLRKSAFALVLLALAIHLSGLLFRMVLEGRPPVTNLYSSAIFIGVGACILGVVLELFWRNAIGLMVSSVIGFVTLIIAHHLALSGDTMEMMRAVLDSNFWLGTHVVVVTLGYASTFVAGFLAILYVVRGVFTPSLTPAIGKSLGMMVYGIVCFATLFSFVGTVLGGIWADQSWGRFWGWDPKENGALIIVLWNALVLHARWGGLVRERGLMNLVIGGNIVTAWSWFGVNMLGIGLHSYGFTDAAAKWLIGFVLLQVALIGIGMIPKKMWRSSREEVGGGAAVPVAA